MNITHIENLLSTLPRELVLHYETSKSLSLSVEVRAYKSSEIMERVGYIVTALCVAGLAFTTSHFGDMEAVVGSIVCTIVLVGVILGARKIATARRECTKRLEEFESAERQASIPRLALIPLGITATRQLAEERITSCAREVIGVEKYFKKIRGGKNYSVIQVVHAGQAVLEAQSRFEGILQGAVQFGLSDGDKRPFFLAAEKQLNQTATSSKEV